MPDRGESKSPSLARLERGITRGSPFLEVRIAAVLSSRLMSDFSRFMISPLRIPVDVAKVIIGCNQSTASAVNRSSSSLVMYRVRLAAL